MPRQLILQLNKHTIGGGQSSGPYHASILETRRMGPTPLAFLDRKINKIYPGIKKAILHSFFFFLMESNFAFMTSKFVDSFIFWCMQICELRYALFVDTFSSLSLIYEIIYSFLSNQVVSCGLWGIDVLTPTFLVYFFVEF